MAGFLSISLWIVLAMVIPGLVTFAAIYGAYTVTSPDFLKPLVNGIHLSNEWIGGSIGITVMILTQAFGILLESLFIRKKWLSGDSVEVVIWEKGGSSLEGDLVKKTGQINPYEFYSGLYILLAELREEEDSQGHLKRVLAQFFLTNNTLISFLAGLIAVPVLVLLDGLAGHKGFHHLPSSIAYAMTMVMCLWISFKVAKIRFKVMARALWASRHCRTWSYGENSGNKDNPANRRIDGTQPNSSAMATAPGVLPEAPFVAMGKAKAKVFESSILDGLGQ